ncbi:MAG: DUF4097 domain-containing protein [Prevotellaceae bacterium]|jgi:hypothetical protein|nr:DUF4097 domain-containing protein [Prevotellaceae bacterium]
MKKTLLLSALLCYAGIGASMQARDDRDKPFISYRFPAQSISSVQAVTSGGFLQVSGDASDEATVEVFIPPNHRKKRSNDEIRKILDEHYTLEVTEKNGQLSAVAKRKGTKWSSNTDLTISFKIRVRSKTDTQLETSGGAITLDNLNGKHNFKTSGGSLNIDKLTGTITGRTSGGRINVRNSRDNIDLQTSGGNIVADECRGNISLATSGGSLNLSNLNGSIVATTSGGSIVMHRLNGEIDATTSGGSISADNIAGTLNTGTSGGSVKINNASGNVEASTSGGTMQVQMKSVENYVRLRGNGHTHLSLPERQGYRLDIKAKKIQTGRAITNFFGSFESDRIDGTIRGGGAEVQISASRITLDFD